MGSSLRRAVGAPGTARFAIAGLVRDVAQDWASGLRQLRVDIAVGDAPAGRQAGWRHTRPIPVIDARASIHGTHLITLAWLVDLLDAGGFEYWTWMRDESYSDVGLPIESRDAFLDAVARGCADGLPVEYILDGARSRRITVGSAQVWRQHGHGPGSGSGLRPHRVVVDAAAPHRWFGDRAFGVVIPRVDPRGRRLIAAEAEVRVSFWSGAPGQRRHAPEPNPWTASLSGDSLARPATLDVGGVHARTLDDLAVTHAEHVAFPIDVVYTWVDGEDPRWRERMLARRGPDEAFPTAATSPARFRSIDELRFSLRSLHQNAPWVRHIWIVTDDQCPTWLGQDPRVTVVDHRDIWRDPMTLPVFNSQAIEAQLHRIPGLSEHYVYLNDDVLLTAPLRPTAFFSPGGVMRIYPSPVQLGLGPWTAEEGAVAASGRNDRELLRRVTSTIQTQRLRHTGHAQRRSIAQELEHRFAEEFARTAASAFRDPRDISPIALQCWYALRTGRAVIGDDVRQAYIDLAAPGAAHELASLDADQFDFVCLNRTETGHGPRDGERAARRFLAGRFPFLAPWEAPATAA